MHLWMDAASLLHLEKIINKAIQQLLLQRIKNRHKVSQGRIASSLTEVVRVEAVVVEDVLGEKLLPANLTLLPKLLRGQRTPECLHLLDRIVNSLLVLP